MSAIQVGDVPEPVALANRESIEAQSAVALPGAIVLDRALSVKSGMTVEGGSIKNGYYSATFPENCSAQCYGKNIGYVDHVTRVSATKWKLVDPAALVNYKVGAVVHASKYDGYFDPNVGQLCSRRIIQGIAGDVLTLSAGIDSRCDSLKWYAVAAPIPDVKIGQTSVSVPTVAQAQQFAPGDYVLISAGADVANSDHMETHRVIAITNVSVQLESPTLRAYRNPVIAKYNPIHGVTLRNMVIEQPIDAGSNALWLKYCTNLRMENVTVNGHMGLGGCSGVTLVNCTITGDLGINSCHGVVLVGCRVARLALEESAFDVLCAGSTFGPHGTPLQSSVGCERLTFRACRVTGGWVSLGAVDTVVDDLQIDATTAMAMITGDRLRVRGLRSEPAVILAGQNCVVQNVQSPSTCLGWVDGSVSSGVVVDCQNVNQVQGAWRVV